MINSLNAFNELFDEYAEAKPKKHTSFTRYQDSATMPDTHHAR